jgi:hypothetical protein
MDVCAIELAIPASTQQLALSRSEMSREAGCPRDQEHTRPDGNGSDGTRNALTRWREAFGGNRPCDKNH